MQTNDLIYEASKQDMRRFTWKVAIAFERDFDPTVTFFSVGDSGSMIGGVDLIPGESDVVQEWDKYTFTEYTSRVIDVQVEREKDFPFSVVAATADVIFNNYDGFFDPNGTSPISPYVLPYRPIKIWMGFDDQYVLKFSGLTERMPSIDDSSKTVSFHCIDFLSLVFDKPLDELPLYENERTDVILAGMLQEAGLSSGQYDLDPGLTYLDVFTATKGQKFVDAAKPLMEVESGTLLMDEQGMIRFKNRQNVNSNIVHAFEKHRDIVDIVARREDDLINTVIIESDVRTLGPTQYLWASSEPVLVPASGTATLWADIPDPAPDVDVPVLDALSGSSYFVYATEDGTGASVGGVTVSSATLYGSSYKMVFSNSNTYSLYVTSVTLYGTPYKISDQLYVRETDAVSVAKYGERVYQTKNDAFQSESVASSKAAQIIDDNNEYGAISEIKVKGTPQFQIDDLISVEVDGRYQVGSIWKIVENMSLDGGFEQTLSLKEYTRRTYFRVGTGGSQIAGTDYLSF